MSLPYYGLQKPSQLLRALADSNRAVLAMQTIGCLVCIAGRHCNEDSSKAPRPKHSSRVGDP
jgi:hypothetical protein